MPLYLLIEKAICALKPIIVTKRNVLPRNKLEQFKNKDLWKSNRYGTLRWVLHTQIYHSFLCWLSAMKHSVRK